MVRVTPEKVSEMEDKFAQVSSGGTVSGKELAKLFRLVGLNPSEKQLSEWKREAGSSCTVDKFVKIAKKKLEESTDNTHEIVDSFAVFDKDGTGYISAVEFKHILTNMGEALSEREMAEVMNEIEVGSNGKIDYQAFAEEVFPLEGH